MLHVMLELYLFKSKLSVLAILKCFHNWRLTLCCCVSFFFSSNTFKSQLFNLFCLLAILADADESICSFLKPRLIFIFSIYSSCISVFPFISWQLTQLPAGLDVRNQRFKLPRRKLYSSVCMFVFAPTCVDMCTLSHKHPVRLWYLHELKL